MLWYSSRRMLHATSANIANFPGKCDSLCLVTLIFSQLLSSKQNVTKTIRERLWVRRMDVLLQTNIFRSSLVEQGPIPRYFYARHESTILKPQFSGKSAWGGLLSLTGLNILVFGMWNTDGDQHEEDWMLDNFTVNLTNVREGRLWTLASASISHQGASHILGNMFAMWLFGFHTYRVIGSSAFYGLYLSGGLACSAAHLGHNVMTGRTQPPLTRTEREMIPKLLQLDDKKERRTRDEAILISAAKKRLATVDMPSLGASGSVMAISAVSAALFPLDRVRINPRFYFIPLPLAVTMFVISDLLGLTQEGDPVDHAGHLGGLLMGAFYVTFAWYSKNGILRILHSAPTGGQLPIVYRFKEVLGTKKRRSHYQRRYK